MRVVSALALIGATTAKPIDVETTVETITEAETTVPETEAITTTTTAAPKKTYANIAIKLQTHVFGESEVSQFRCSKPFPTSYART